MKPKTIDDTFLKYVESSNKLIEEKRIFLEEKGLNVESLKFKTNEDNYENIKNFFRFCILISNNIINDFDCDEVVIKSLEKRYSNCKYKVEYKEKRYFKINNKYIFETDTAHSFKTIFYQFLRDYYYEEFNEYLKYNGNIPSGYDRYVYILNKLENNKFKFKDKHLDLINLFNELAGLYHSINNVVLVPYGYNMLRSEKFNDIYCLSIYNLLNEGYDSDFIKTLCCFKNFDYDIDFYNEVKDKTRVIDNNIDRIKLTEKQYEKYLRESINYIYSN